MYAARPGDASHEPQVIWRAPRRGGRDLSAPIVVGDYVIVTSLNGIATCYDAKTGKDLWKERLNGQFSSSPIAIGRCAYYQNEAGETVVIEPGPELHIVRAQHPGAGHGRTVPRLVDPLRRTNLLAIGTRLYTASGLPRQSG